ncbi:MAG: tetraacyldisaccharide 4'-kinase [Coxiellaceae bacterium]|nr:tetraacyldisaccharide 4'-kinase [Coxiellaceae bacterium]
MKFWYQKRSLTAWMLSPLALLYHCIVSTRKAFYHLGIFKTTTIDVPVVVVGNITVGGTGKSPMVGWLADYLRSQGFKPGIVSRGYGGSLNKQHTLVTTEHHAHEVGDEALMLFQKTHLPIVVCRDRVAAAHFLLAQTDCDIIISDDGLQHFAMHRDLEIIMVDGKRRFGNGWCLPAGPLRELKSRCEKAPWVVYTNDDQAPYNMQLKPSALLHQGQSIALAQLNNKTVHAVAGIGHPERFFETLRSLGANVIEHPLPDHHQFSAQDLQFNDERWVVITAKDAVKCLVRLDPSAVIPDPDPGSSQKDNVIPDPGVVIPDPDPGSSQKDNVIPDPDPGSSQKALSIYVLEVEAQLSHPLLKDLSQALSQLRSASL